MAARENKDSPQHELVWHVCRECHKIQHCVVIRGWNVCRLCLEGIDREYTSKRADDAFAKIEKERLFCFHTTVTHMLDGSLLCDLCKKEVVELSGGRGRILKYDLITGVSCRHCDKHGSYEAGCNACQWETEFGQHGGR